MISTQCLQCVHYRPLDIIDQWPETSPDDYLRKRSKALTTATCTAFPEGIPLDIWTGKFTHTRRWPGDNGIRFQKQSAA